MKEFSVEFLRVDLSNSLNQIHFCVLLHCRTFL
jgi:hypothetical protein